MSDWELRPAKQERYHSYSSSHKGGTYYSAALTALQLVPSMAPDSLVCLEFWMGSITYKFIVWSFYTVWYRWYEHSKVTHSVLPLNRDQGSQRIIIWYVLKNSLYDSFWTAKVKYQYMSTRYESSRTYYCNTNNSEIFSNIVIVHFRLFVTGKSNVLLKNNHLKGYHYFVNEDRLKRRPVKRLRGSLLYNVQILNPDEYLLPYELI